MNRYKSYDIRLDIDTGMLYADDLDLRASTWDELKKLIDAEVRAENKLPERYAWMISARKPVRVKIGKEHTSRYSPSPRGTTYYWVTWTDNRGQHRMTTSTGNLYDDTPEVRAALEKYIVMIDDADRLEKEADALLKKLPHHIQ